MTTHELKTIPEMFEAVFDERKTYEIRRDDRGYRVNDELVLREFKNEQYTGRTVWANISHILKGPIYGLMEGWVILSIRITDYDC